MRFSGHLTSTFKEVNDVTASRVIGTEYTNNTGKIMFVDVTCFCTVTGAGGTAFFRGDSPTGTQIQYAGFATSPIQEGYFNLSYMIPVNQTYKIVKSEVNGTVALTKWIEVY